MEMKIRFNCDFCKSSFKFYLLKCDPAFKADPSSCVLSYLVCFKLKHQTIIHRTWLLRYSKTA